MNSLNTRPLRTTIFASARADRVLGNLPADFNRRLDQPVMQPRNRRERRAMQHDRRAAADYDGIPPFLGDSPEMIELHLAICLEVAVILVRACPVPQTPGPIDLTDQWDSLESEPMRLAELAAIPSVSADELMSDFIKQHVHPEDFEAWLLARVAK